MHRQTLIAKVLACLSAGLSELAQVDLLKASQPQPDLTERAQLTLIPTAERQASELQAKGADKGVTYGPAYNKNLSPNALDRRVMTLQLELALEEAEPSALIARLDNLVSAAEASIIKDETPVPWQHFICEKSSFSYSNQVNSMLAKTTLTWQFYYQVEYPEEAGVEVTEVYLGPHGGEHRLIYKTPEEGPIA
ncbi:hypothetical protein [Pseudoalteromonas maricaloris]|uniref:hypothetical protein n=1 Tax=Pseudoalteromonas maricaloris TaxID=184924 RepID=UPI00057FA372|nr:hypothetical protein [Pseudoalteromonas flavipulchra]KID34309.1 hypothetical protein QT15_18065 [Pseudoalteromonas flavipulchra NCIMB 2033 = ATCC BAA-314]MBD0784594.1 hypothetical protein [Pseudoalteromonas flavipulchra]MBE0372073.1 hypothetical protein [Pseudoalteromonas flavipulchra NCIMB 2033 = ATCC BAA-314]